MCYGLFRISLLCSEISKVSFGPINGFGAEWWHAISWNSADTLHCTNLFKFRKIIKRSYLWCPSIYLKMLFINLLIRLVPNFLCHFVITTQGNTSRGNRQSFDLLKKSLQIDVPSYTWYDANITTGKSAWWTSFICVISASQNNASRLFPYKIWYDRNCYHLYR